MRVTGDTDWHRASQGGAAATMGAKGEFESESSLRKSIVPHRNTWWLEPKPCLNEGRSAIL